VTAQQLGSLPILVVGNLVCGAAAALGYRGGLAVTNGLAPPERRAELASAYFVCCFLGNAIPVIGAGALSQALGAKPADLIFAGVVSAIALGALVASFIRRGPAEPA
jgi:MFS family permease